MIEFTIPLILPVRAVEITATIAGPSERLQQEMTRWAANPWPSTSHFAQHDRSTETASNSPSQSNLADLEKERQALKAQQELFINAVRELKLATQQAQSQLTGLVVQLQEAAVEIGHAVATKLLFEQIDAGNYPIADLVHEVITRLDTTSNVVVKLHPDDLVAIQEFPTIGDDGQESRVRFVADGTLSRGDCRAKAGEITVIYELRRQVDEIRRQLLSTVTGHAET